MRFDFDKEGKRYKSYFEQLKAAGLTDDLAEYGALILWLNAYSMPNPFEKINFMDFFIKKISDRSTRIKTCSLALKTLEKNAYDLSHEDITLVQSIRQAENVGIPATKILRKNLSG